MARGRAGVLLAALQDRKARRVVTRADDRVGVVDGGWESVDDEELPLPPARPESMEWSPDHGSPAVVAAEMASW